MEIEFRGEGFSAGGPVFLFPYNHGGVALPAAESLATKIKAKRAGHVTLKHAEVATAPGATETLDFDVMVNGVAQTGHADINDTATEDSPTTDPDAIAVDDEIGVRVTRSATAANTGEIRVLLEYGQ